MDIRRDFWSASMSGECPSADARQVPRVCRLEASLMRKKYFGIHVECYAGYRGEEEPRKFSFQQKNLEITEIVDRWLDPGHRYFKVRARDGGIYILRHAVHSGLWELTVYLEGGE